MLRASHIIVARRWMAFWQLMAVVLASGMIAPIAVAQDCGDPIWTPLGASKPGKEAECFFRKQFTLVRPQRGELYYAASGSTKIFVNGLQVNLPMGDVAERVEISRMLRPGVNLIAIQVTSSEVEPYIAARLRVKEARETEWRCLTTDPSWLTHRQPSDGWQTVGFPDLSWVRAHRLDVSTDAAQRSELSIAGADGGLPTSVDRIAQSDAQRVAVYSQRVDSEGGRTISIDPPLEPPVQHQIVLADGSRDEPAQPVQAGYQPPVENAAEADAMRLASAAAAESQPEVAESVEAGPIPEEPAAVEYKLPPQFAVEAVLDASETESLIAMAFNEFGMLVLSREGGPLLLADLSQPTGRRIRVACDQVKNCQGILAFNGNLYVTGDGPQGAALYELTFDSNQKTYRVSKALARFMGTPGEHGPHGIALGPDGMIYVTVGSSSYLAGEWPTTSPLNQSFDTDLLPKYEDPGGHAAGVKAPGGTIFRVSVDGSKLEIVAGGLRNAYDLVFNAAGDLFVHDADMESDLGLPWYLPTQVYHVAHGVDLGWRSGWSRVAPHLPDTVPAMVSTGRGSPTGAACYRHVQYPIGYHGALFFGDWSAGRILVVRPTRDGSTYAGDVEVFLQANPLNVTDLDVGEDGSLYFCTGGRGTRGGVYRVRWTGSVPQEWVTFADNVARVVRHPQPTAAWARQNLAVLSQSQDSNWSEKLLSAARDRSMPPADRAQALEAVMFYCGLPDVTALNDLSTDYSELVRARVAQLCGMDYRGIPTLEKLLDDRSPFVVRQACESYLRLDAIPPREKLFEILARTATVPATAANQQSDSAMTAAIDRHLQTVVRRLLERSPAADWWSDVNTSTEPQVFIQGALALASAHPTPEHCQQIVERCNYWMNQSLADYELVDVLRVLQVTLCREAIEPGLRSELVGRLAQHFPANNESINQEIVPLLIHLQAEGKQELLLQYLRSNSSSAAVKTRTAMQIARGASWLNDDLRLEVIDTLHQSRQLSAAGTYRLYLQRSIREVANQVGDDRITAILERGADWVDALVPIFYRIQAAGASQYISQLIQLDTTLQGSGDDSALQARLGIIALLADSGQESAFDHLRSCWRREPARRNEIALGLSRQPEGKNWSYLVSSLPQLDDLTCVEVIDQLRSVALRPADPRHYRELLETGYRLQDASANKVSELFEHWTQQPVADETSDWRSRLNGWKTWYEQRWPGESPVTLPKSEKFGRYSVPQVLQHWASLGPRADRQRGQQLFVSANCVQCHRVGSIGDSAGPDLTSLASRFSRREAVEAVVDPSRVIPDRYRSTLLLNDQGVQFVGLLTDNGDSYTILQQDGQRVRIDKNAVEEMRAVETSVMPSGMLDKLTLDQVADLMAFIMDEQPAQVGQSSPASDRR